MSYFPILVLESLDYKLPYERTNEVLGDCIEIHGEASVQGNICVQEVSRGEMDFEGRDTQLQNMHEHV